MSWFPAHFDYEDVDPEDISGSNYQEWRLPDSSRYHVEEMPDCCNRVFFTLNPFDAEFECPECGAYWRVA